MNLLLKLLIEIAIYIGISLLIILGYETHSVISSILFYTAAFLMIEAFHEFENKFKK